MVYVWNSRHIIKGPRKHWHVFPVDSLNAILALGNIIRIFKTHFGIIWSFLTKITWKQKMSFHLITSQDTLYLKLWWETTQELYVSPSLNQPSLTWYPRKCWTTILVFRSHNQFPLCDPKCIVKAAILMQSIDRTGRKKFNFHIFSKIVFSNLVFVRYVKLKLTSSHSSVTMDNGICSLVDLKDTCGILLAFQSED